MGTIVFIAYVKAWVAIISSTVAAVKLWLWLLFLVICLNSQFAFSFFLSLCLFLIVHCKMRVEFQKSTLILNGGRNKDDRISIDVKVPAEQIHL